MNSIKPYAIFAGVISSLAVAIAAPALAASTGWLQTPGVTSESTCRGIAQAWGAPQYYYDSDNDICWVYVTAE